MNQFVKLEFCKPQQNAMFIAHWGTTTLYDHYLGYIAS